MRRVAYAAVCAFADQRAMMPMTIAAGTKESASPCRLIVITASFIAVGRPKACELITGDIWLIGYRGA